MAWVPSPGCRRSPRRTLLVLRAPRCRRPCGLSPIRTLGARKPNSLPLSIRGHCYPAPCGRKGLEVNNIRSAVSISCASARDASTVRRRHGERQLSPQERDNLP